MTSSASKAKSIAELAARGWVSLAQFAQIIGVSYPTVQRMKRDGEVEIVRVGGVNRVYQEEVHRYLVKGNKVDEGASTPHPLPDIDNNDKEESND